jgi:UDP:flavonoid glycosyltransferase YjiC (YdhE family)
MMLRGLWYAYGSAMRETCDLFGVDEMTYKDFSNAWLNTPTFIAASPEVIPPPSDYPSHVHVTGFLFLDQSADWTPDPNLSNFLDAGEPPVYIGFGSMTGHASEDAALLIDALDGRRAVISQGWSDMHSSNLPDSVYLLKSAPHDWLFPRMSAVVHHGGAGTLAASLRAGVPILVIPHLADQFYFGRRVHELGAGPKPIPRRKLNAPLLKSALDDLLETETFHSESERLGRKIQKEDGVTNIVRVIEKYLRSD